MAGVVVLGASGQLGSDLCQELARAGIPFTPLTHSDIEVCDHSQVREVLTRLRPDVVINTTAFHKVDLCEDEVERSFAVNCYAVRHLALLCQEMGARLVHISTDYVFGGDKESPYREDDPPNPLNVYGVSKLAGEYFVRHLCQKHLIVRSSGLYGLRGSTVKGGNFVETMLRLGRERGEVSVVTDQVLTPTYTPDLAAKIRELVEAEAQGTYHVTSGGHCSWYEFASHIFRLWDPTVKVHPTTSDAFPSRARRPRYSVLDNYRLRTEGFSLLRPWQEALAEYIARRRQLAASKGS